MWVISMEFYFKAEQNERLRSGRYSNSTGLSNLLDLAI
jgi:hypothetical protein